MLEVDGSENRKLLHEETTIRSLVRRLKCMISSASTDARYRWSCFAAAQWQNRRNVFRCTTKEAWWAIMNIDVLVDGCVAVEIKVALQYDKGDEAQLLNELKLRDRSSACPSTSAEARSGTSALCSKSVFHPCSSVAE